MKATTIALGFALLLGGIVGTAHGIKVMNRPEQPPPAAQSEQVAKDLAAICDMLGEYKVGSLDGMGVAWLPDSAKKLGPLTAELNPNGGSLYRGRERPYYHLQHRADGNWVLHWTSQEESREIAVVTVPNGGLRREDFVARALAGYADELDRGPNELGEHLSRVEFSMKFQWRRDTRALVADSIRRWPERSELRMALALVDAAEHRNDGLNALRDWALASPSYVHHTDVALTNVMIGRPSAAIEAMRAALTLPMVESKDASLNTTARALPVIRLALRQGLDQDARFLAEQVLEKEPSTFTKQRFQRELRAIMGAALYRSGDTTGAKRIVADGLAEEDPFYRTANDPLVKLATAIEKDDTTTIKAWVPFPEENISKSLFMSFDLVAALGLDK